MKTKTEKIFSLFLAWYGERFTRMWADTSVEAMRNVWAHEIERFSDETIKAALKAIRTEGENFPPSLPHFVSLCEKQKQVHPSHVMLPKMVKDVSSADALAKLAQMGRTLVRPTETDKRQWARDIIARAKAGDRSMSTAVVRIAERALRGYVAPVEEPEEMAA